MIKKTLQEEGIAGIEAYIKKNDIRWFITMVVICLMFAGFYAENRVSVREEASVEAHRLADSLHICYQNKLDSIVKANDWDPAIDRLNEYIANKNASK
jgi:hypothetical protein